MIAPLWTYDEFMRLVTERGLLELNVYEEYTVRKGDPILVFESYDNIYNVLAGHSINVNTLNVRAVREYTYKLTPFKLAGKRIGLYLFKGPALHTKLGGMVAWMPDSFL